MKWRERSKRVNFDKLFFLFSERDLCSFNEVKAFDLFYANRKVVFTSGDYSQIASAAQLRRYSNQTEVGGADEIIADVINSFDLITWLNN
jgi:uncharacterized protein (DUF1919 family)